MFLVGVTPNIIWNFLCGDTSGFVCADFKLKFYKGLNKLPVAFN